LESHTCTLIGGKHYVYGGAISKPVDLSLSAEAKDEDGLSGSGEDLDSQNQLYQVEILGQNLEEIRVDFQKVEIKGKTPYLDEHAAVSIEDRYLVLLGGSTVVERDGEPLALDEIQIVHNTDIFVIDVVEKEIVTAANIGKSSLKPCTASAAATDGKRIFVFGGIEQRS